MFDRRVVRGPTFRSKTDLSASVTQLNPQHKASSSSAIKASSARPAKPLLVLPSSSASIVPLTSTVTAQTDDYLEELTDEIFEQENATQTDAALLPPSSSAALSALYVPKPRGTDAWTAIEGVELFDFDQAVLPVLSTLSARALDQALTEVREEEELCALLSSRLRFERERDLTQAEVQRLQAEHERRLAEKERRFAQERERLLAAQHAQQQRAATEAAEHAREQERIEDEERVRAAQGDPLEEEVKDRFLPWLFREVRLKVEEEERGRSAVDALVKASIQAIAEGRAQEETRREAERVAALEERLRVEREAEEERLRVIAEADAKKAAEAAAEAARIAAEQSTAAAEDGDEDGGDD